MSPLASAGTAGLTLDGTTTANTVNVTIQAYRRIEQAITVAYEYGWTLGDEGIADFSPFEPLADAMALMRAGTAVPG